MGSTGSSPTAREAKSMSLKIVAVGMRDLEVFGCDSFYVQTGDDEARLYESHRDGRVEPVNDEAEPMAIVTSSIEKFGAMYRVTPPVPLASVDELTGFLGKFAISSATAVRYAGSADSGEQQSSGTET